MSGQSGDPAPEDPRPWNWSLPEEPVPDFRLSGDIPEAIPLIECWRCGKAVAETAAQCPYCLARARHLPPDSTEGDPAPLTHLFWTYGVLLATSIIFAAIQSAVSEKQPEQVQARQQLQFMLALELVDTVAVVMALLLMSRPPVVAGPTVETRILTWFCGLPALVGLLGMNLAYHALLKRVINSPGWLDQLTIKQQVNLLSILVICVQPAIVEELYFRYLALGTLRRFMGVHGAVLISSVMFGLAHLGVPLSVPMLTVIGVGLGYLRVYSGSLVLPMLVHLAHNTVVLIIEAR